MRQPDEQEHQERWAELAPEDVKKHAITGFVKAFSNHYNDASS